MSRRRRLLLPATAIASLILMTVGASTVLASGGTFSNSWSPSQPTMSTPVTLTTSIGGCGSGNTSVPTIIYDVSGGTVGGVTEDYNAGYSDVTLSDGGATATGTADLGEVPAGTYSVMAYGRGTPCFASSVTYTFSSTTTMNVGGPSAPTAVTAIAEVNGSVVVYWVGATDPSGAPITSYNVTPDPACASCSGLSVSGNPAVRLTTISGLTLGQTYSFTATASDANGTSASSTPSNEVTAATLPGPPGSPVTAEPEQLGPGDAGAVVSWEPAPANGAAVEYYTVSSSPGYATCDWLSGPLTCALSGLSYGVAYTFTVTATNAMGMGPASLSSNTVTEASSPDQVTGVNAVPGSESATVTWSAPADEGSTITAYTATSSPGGQSCIWSAGPLQCTVFGLENGIGYTLTVAATNVDGAGPASDPSNEVTPGAVPDQVTGVSALGGDASATVSWSAPNDNGSATSVYTVTASPGGATCSWTSGPLTCVFSGLSNGTAYSFTVSATNGFGNGPTSDPSNEVTPGAVPDQVTGMSAVGGQASATASWSAPNDNGSAITAYTVTASPGGATCRWTSGPLACNFSGLSDGTPYSFTVSASNGFGAGLVSAPSNEVTPGAVPDQVTGVSALGGQASATVSWSAPNANGSAISTYTVVASPGGAGCSWTSGPLSCTFSGLADGTAYSFTMSATNGFGTGPGSALTQPVTPNSPALWLSLAPTTGLGSYLVSGTGLLPGSGVRVTIHSSSPVVLATMSTAIDGEVNLIARVPAGTSAGAHTLVAQGLAPDGSVITGTLAITVASAASPSAPDTGSGLLGPQLPVPTLALLLAGLLLLALGLGTGLRRRWDGSEG